METKRIENIEGLNHLWKVDNLYLAGQPSAESVSAIKDFGVERIFNLRNEAEMDFSTERENFETAGLEYHQMTILDETKTLDRETVIKLNSMIDPVKPNFIHCGTANRVGGWLITYLVLNRKMDFDAAVEIAKNNGLTNPGFIEQARTIIQG